MKFKDLRIKAGLTEAQLAREVGNIAKAMISKLEAGMPISRETVQDALDIINYHLETKYTIDDLDDANLAKPPRYLDDKGASS